MPNELQYAKTRFCTKGQILRPEAKDRTLAEPYSPLERQREFNIHGVLGVQLLDAEARDVAAVRRHLGPLEEKLFREPDLVVRFVKQLPRVASEHQALRSKGFAKDSFLPFDERAAREAAQIAVNFDRQPCEILCRSGLRSIAVLLPILSLIALKKGYVAIHGSAFVYDGVGVVMAGPATSGKTTILLGFASLGAEFVGDDWVLLRRDGQRMHGLPTAIELSPQHAESSRFVRHTLGSFRRTGFDFLGAVMAMVDGSPVTFVKPAGQRIITAIQRRIIPRVRPQHIFAKCAKSFTAKPQKVFLLVKHSDPVVQVKEIHRKEMAELLSRLAEHEQKSIMELYQTYRFAFPKCKSMFFEEVFTRQRDTLLDAVAAQETYIIRHPYPIRFADLYETISPFFASRAREAESAALCP